MQVDLIFKIAAIGILIAIVSVYLSKSGKEEVAMLFSLAGLSVLFIMVMKELSTVFDTVKSLFRL